MTLQAVSPPWRLIGLRGATSFSVGFGLVRLEAASGERKTRLLARPRGPS